MNLRDAVEAAQLRSLAIAGLGRDSPEQEILLEEGPEHAIRGLLSGTMEAEDMEVALNLLCNLGDSVTKTFERVLMQEEPRGTAVGSASAALAQALLIGWFLHDDA